MGMILAISQLMDPEVELLFPIIQVGLLSFTNLKMESQKRKSILFNMSEKALILIGNNKHMFIQPLFHGMILSFLLLI